MLITCNQMGKIKLWAISHKTLVNFKEKSFKQLEQLRNFEKNFVYNLTTLVYKFNHKLCPHSYWVKPYSCVWLLSMPFYTTQEWEICSCFLLASHCELLGILSVVVKICNVASYWRRKKFLLHLASTNIKISL